MSIKRTGILLLANMFEDTWSNKLQNPVFLIGCARSGTTLLSKLLGMHRDIVNWSELNDIWDPTGYPWRESNHKTPPIWADPVAFTERWWHDNQKRQRDLRAVLGAYQWLHRTPIILNKSPLNTFRIPYLLKIFPEAKFINMIRDGRAVVNSYTKKQLAEIQEFPEPYRSNQIEYDFEELAKHLAHFWKANINEVKQQKQAQGLSEKAQIIDVKYEALCARTTDTLENICSFLGVSPSKFNSAVREINVTNRNHKWRENFDDDLATQLTEIMEPTLSEEGYS